MTHDEYRKERQAYERRRAERLAQQAAHVPTTAIPFNAGDLGTEFYRKLRDDAYVPPLYAEQTARGALGRYRP